jgi:hypothetical protein
MSWTTAVTELRTLLSDGPTDRLRFRKAVIGEVDGSNVVYKTFEYRRITNFKTGSASPFGVYKVLRSSGAVTLLSNSDFASDAVAEGIFVLNVAITQGYSLEATYYVQWFDDAELSEMINEASMWVLSVEAPANVPSGLKPAVLQYAASLAYQKMAMRWRERHAEVFRTEDAPNDKQQTPTQEFMSMSKAFMDRASVLRKQFYTRQDQNEQPLFATAVGRVRDTTPRT